MDGRKVAEYNVNEWAGSKYKKGAWVVVVGIERNFVILRGRKRLMCQVVE